MDRVGVEPTTSADVKATVYLLCRKTWLSKKEINHFEC
jgi:hypothetical protein